MRKKFEGSSTEEGMGAGNAIFEGLFKFSASEAMKKFDSTDSEDQGKNWGAIRERLGSNQGAIEERLGSK